LAGEDVPVADVLSTATSLLALGIVGTADDGIKGKAVEFVNLHWHDAGGFFGSIADQIPDVEYTFYGLLTIGV
jgi:geranylgeranyl transferase type-2 subunit beta